MADPKMVGSMGRWLIWQIDGESWLWVGGWFEKLTHNFEETDLHYYSDEMKDEWAILKKYDECEN